MLPAGGGVLPAALAVTLGSPDAVGLTLGLADIEVSEPPTLLVPAALPDVAAEVELGWALALGTGGTWDALALDATVLVLELAVTPALGIAPALLVGELALTVARPPACSFGVAELHAPKISRNGTRQEVNIGSRRAASMAPAG